MHLILQFKSLISSCKDIFLEIKHCIYISTFAGYLEDGVLQTDSVKLRQHYMNTTTFYVDLLCLLPLDFLYLSLDFQSMLRVCRLVKIYRFWEFLDRTERHTNYPNFFRLCSLVHYLLGMTSKYEMEKSYNSIGFKCLQNACFTFHILMVYFSCLPLECLYILCYSQRNRIWFRQQHTFWPGIS